MYVLIFPQCLDLRSMPWKASRHDLLYNFLQKFETLLTDYASMDFECKQINLLMMIKCQLIIVLAFIRVPVTMVPNELDAAVPHFWTHFYKKCDSFLKADSLVIQSPLLSGDVGPMRTVMKHADTVVQLNF